MTMRKGFPALKWFPVVMLLVLIGGTVLGLALEHEQVLADSTTLYWYGGSGNWSSGTSHWSSNSGNSPSATHASPTATNPVIINAASGSGTITLDTSGSCASMDWTGSSITGFTMGTNTLNIGGYLTMVSGVTQSGTGAITFSATSGSNNITMAGKFSTNSFIFNGVGGTWVLQDTFNIGTNAIQLTNGTLNTNGITLTTGSFTMNAGTKTLTLGASTWNCGGNWTATTANTSLNANTSVVKFTSVATQFTGGTLTYNEADFNGSGAAAILDANTFATLTRNGTATTTDTFVLSANQIVTTSLNTAGNSAANRLAVKSNTTTARTITSASNAVVNTDFYYINGAGAASWDFHANTGGCADMGGNSGITFSSDYWVGGTGNYLDGTHWSGASGGTAHADFLPVATASVRFDANSFTAGSQSVTINGASVCNNMDWTGATNTPTWTGTNALTIYGSLTTIAGMNFTYSGTITFAATSGTNTITTGGLTLNTSMTFNGVGGTWQIG